MCGKYSPWYHSVLASNLNKQIKASKVAKNSSVSKKKNSSQVPKSKLSSKPRKSPVAPVVHKKKTDRVIDDMKDVTLSANAAPYVPKFSLSHIVRPEKAKKEKKRIPGKYDHIVLKDEDIFGLGAYGRTVVEGKEEKEVFVDVDTHVSLHGELEEEMVLVESHKEGKVNIETYVHYPLGEKSFTSTYVSDPYGEYRFPVEVMSEHPPLVDKVEHTEVHIEPVTQVVEFSPITLGEEIDDSAFGFFDDAPPPPEEKFDFVKNKVKFTFGETVAPVKPTKKLMRQMGLIPTDEQAMERQKAAKIASDAGIARKKREYKKAKNIQRAEISSAKREDVKKSRENKARYVQGWMESIDDMHSYIGTSVPKDKHQKKVRARKVSNLTVPVRTYTAQEVRAYRAEVKERKIQKKMMNHAVTEGKNFLTENVDASFGPIAVRWIEWLINFIDVIRTICRFKDAGARRCILSQWIQAQGVRLIESTLLSIFVTKIVEEAPHVPQFEERRPTTEALSDQIDNLGDILEYTFDSTFADAVKNLLVSCASMHFFGSKVDHRIFFYLGAPMRLPVYDLTRIAVKSLAKVVKAMEDINDGATLSEALFMKDPWVYNRAKFTQLMFQQNHLYTGLPVEGKFAKPLWLKESDEVLTYFRQRLRMTSNLKAQYTELSQMITQLEEARCNVLVTLSGGYRNAPFAICLGEDPGVGKSNLIDFVVYEWCRVQGYNFSPDLIFHRDTTSDFWDGLSSQIAYHYSELGTSSKKMAECKGDPIAMEMTSIIDSVMKPVNMADLKDKGKVMATPEMVVVDTNNFSMNFDVMTCNKAAFYRRFLFIKITVKPQYCKANSCQIDYSKCNDGSHPMDRWTFKVWREVAKDATTTTPEKLMECGDIFALSALLREQYAAHIASQTFVEELRKDNRLFRLNPEEKDFPENVPETLLDNPIGKTLINGIFEKAGEYAEYSRFKWNELKSRIQANTGPAMQRRPPAPEEMKEFPEETDWFGMGSMSFDLDEDHIQPMPSPDPLDDQELEVVNLIRSDSFSQMDEKDQEIALMNLRGVTEMKTESMSLVEVRRKNEEIIEKDLGESYYIWIAGRKHLYFIPRFSMIETITLGDVRRYCQARAKCPVLIAHNGEFVINEHAEFVVDKDGNEFRLEDDIDVVAPPNFINVAQYDRAFVPGKSHRESWYGSFLNCIFFMIGMTFNLSLALISVPSLLFDYFGEWNETAHFLTFIASMFVPGFTYIRTWFFVSFISAAMFGKEKFFAGVRRRFNSVLVAIGLPKWKLSSKATKMVMIASAAVIAVLLYWRRISRVGSSQSSENEPQRNMIENNRWRRVHAEELIQEVKDVHEKIAAGKSYRKINHSRNKDIWIDVVDHKEESAHKDEMIYLYRRAMKNVRRFKIEVPGKRRSWGYAIGLRNSCFVAPAHYFHNIDDYCELEMWCSSGGVQNGGSHVVKLRNHDLIETGPDQVVFRMTDVVFQDLMPHISEGPGAEIGRGMFNGDDVKMLFSRDKMIIDIADTNDSYILPEWYTYEYQTESGDCGLPVAFERDRGKSVVGMHVAGALHNGVKSGYATPFVRSLLEKAVCELTKGISQSLNEPEVETFVADTFHPFSELEDPIPASSFRHEDLRNIELHGKFPGKVNINSKSSLRRSILADYELTETWCEVFGEYPSVLYGPPLMQPKWVNGVYLNPWSLNLIKTNKVRKCLDRDDCREAEDIMFQHILSGLKQRGVPKLSPLDIDAAINGVVEDEFLRRVNASTAAGFGLKGKKRDHMPKVEGEKRELTAQLQKLVAECFERFERGEYVHFVYTASLKDEPRDINKVAKGKTRVFFMSQLVALVIMRMLLGPLYLLMVEFSEVFGACIGMNVHREAGNLFKELSKFSHLWMEGDYGNYDVSMPPDIGQSVNNVIVRLLEALGYNDHALKMVKGALAENLNVHVCMNLDIYSVFGIQPSGKFATAEDNSLRGLFALIYAFVRLDKKQGGPRHDFFREVLPKLYGDDVLCSVKERVSSWFNNLTYAKVVDEEYGMEYTNSLKTAVFRPFISPSEASFLKRTFHIHPGLQRIVGKLDHNSIFKSLVWMEPSGNISEAEQLSMTIDSSLREAFFHLNEEKYMHLRDVLIALYSKHFTVSAKIRKTHFHDYRTLLTFYATEIDRKGLHLDSTLESPTEAFAESGTCVCKVRSINNDYRVCQPECYGQRWRAEKKQRPSQQDLQHLIAELETELKQITDEEDLGPFPSMTPRDMKRLREYQQSQQVRDTVEAYEALYHRKLELKSTIAFAKSALSRHSSNTRFRAESLTGAQAEGPVSTSNIEVHQNVTDVGGEENKDYGILNYSSPIAGTRLNMDDFIDRPVLINTYTIVIGNFFSLLVNPWQYLLNDPSVRAKLRNYAFFRGNLKIRIALSASPFHYGKLIVAYVPQATNNDIYNFYAGASSAYNWQMMQWFSQNKIVHYMDVGDNKPLEFEIPFVNFQHWIRLFNNATTAISGNFADTANLGRLAICTLTNVASANTTAPTSLSFTVYVWTDDGEVCGSTGTQVAITTEGKNEMITGPVEKAASAAASASNALSTIPIISPYATASGKVFQSLAYLASLFGWSAPLVSPSIDCPHHIKNDAFQNAVTTVTRSMAKKLTFEPQQGLDVDPRICGTDEDELTFASMCSVMSLLDSFVWSESSTAMSTILWSAYVHPHVNRMGPTSVGKTFIQPTMLAYATLPFEFWRGDIVFHFMIVRSQLHQGKLAVLFDPNVSQYTIITTTLHLNKQYMAIIDLAETSEFSVCCKWNFPKQWARCPNEPERNRSMGGNFAAASATSLFSNANGFITVFPYTALQSPDSNATVTVNVFVSSPNMNLNYFDTAHLPLARAVTQSKNEIISEYEATCFELAEPNLSTDGMSRYHFGEQPRSFRSYLKRFYTTYSATIAAFTGNTDIYYARKIMPDVNPAWGTSVAVASSDLLSYLRLAFIGWKGSMRKRILFNSCDFGPQDLVYVGLTSDAFAPADVAFVSGHGTPKVSHIGYATFVPRTNGGIEVELPCYSSNLFLPSGQSLYAQMAGLSDTNFENFGLWQYVVWGTTNVQASATIGLQEQTATGEDFQLLGRLAAVPYISTSV